jgi:hypothetical protein
MPGRGMTSSCQETIHRLFAFLFLIKVEAPTAANMTRHFLEDHTGDWKVDKVELFVDAATSLILFSRIQPVYEEDLKFRPLDLRPTIALRSPAEKSRPAASFLS